MLGLKHITVKLVPHSYKWRYLFQEEVINIRKVLDNRGLRIEHVGSTALRGIVAKPILDMFSPCEDLSIVADYVEPLAELGYELVTDGSAYKLFIKGSEEARTHHLTFTSAKGAYWQETIQFRDHLLAHPDIAKAYEAEKIVLAEQYATSRRNYSSNKARFIQTVLREIHSTSTAIRAKYVHTPLPLLSTHINPKVITVIQSDIKGFVDSRKFNEKSVSQFRRQDAKRL